MNNGEYASPMRTAGAAAGAFGGTGGGAAGSYQPFNSVLTPGVINE